MQVSPTTLFLVEGCGQLGVAMCWGDGFITDHNIIAQTGISDPNPFFQTLLGKPYLDNVVISPHYYPPSVSGGKGQNTGCERLSLICVGRWYKWRSGNKSVLGLCWDLEIGRPLLHLKCCHGVQQRTQEDRLVLVILHAYKSMLDLGLMK